MWRPWLSGATPCSDGERGSPGGATFKLAILSVSASAAAGRAAMTTRKTKPDRGFLLALRVLAEPNPLANGKREWRVRDLARRGTLLAGRACTKGSVCGTLHLKFVPAGLAQSRRPEKSKTVWSLTEKARGEGAKAKGVAALCCWRRLRLTRAPTQGLQLAAERGMLRDEPAELPSAQGAPPEEREKEARFVELLQAPAAAPRLRACRAPRRRRRRGRRHWARRARQPRAGEQRARAQAGLARRRQKSASRFASLP